MRSKTINLFDRVREIETEELAEERAREDELIELINEEFSTYAEVPNTIENKFDEIQQRKATLKGEAQSIKMELIDWSSVYNLEELEDGDGGYFWEDVEWDRVDSEFTIAKMNAATMAAVEDEVVEKSFDVDPQNETVSGSPKTGFGRVRVLEKAIIDAPEGSPHNGKGEPMPGSYDNALSEYLFEVVDHYNTTGETDLGNSSLRERMTEKEE